MIIKQETELRVSRIKIVYEQHELPAVKQHIATYNEKGFYVSDMGNVEGKDKRFYELKKKEI